MSGDKKATETTKTTKAAVGFLEIAKEVLSPNVFFDSTKRYTGSINPTEFKWKEAGAIPIEPLAAFYKSSTLLDLTPILQYMALTTSQVSKLQEIEKTAKGEIQQKDLYDRFAEYQDSLWGLVSSSKMLQDTVFELRNVSDSDTTWVESTKANMEWIKESATKSVARIYQAFGGVFDKVTGKLEEIVALLSRWGTGLKNQFVKKIRELAEHFMELMNNLLSGLFAWLGKIKQIALEKGFTLKKITVTIDPIGFDTVTIFGLSIPVPELKLPKIEMEFE